MPPEQPPSPHAPDDEGSTSSSPSAESDSALGLDGGEIYIDNAGLVLLWPFLQRFFSKLDLLDDEQGNFASAAARHRATGILQYLVSGDVSPSDDFLLPLNKLLCGLDQAEVVEFGPPMTDEEIETSEELLTAVINRIPALGNASISVFRDVLLQRAAHLSISDNQWRLRVEPGPVDVLLDHVPWSISVLKLPWMEAPIQVEWRE